MTLERVRRFFALGLVHTSQLQPMTGTPTLVPVPKRIISPGNGVVRNLYVTDETYLEGAVAGGEARGFWALFLQVQWFHGGCFRTSLLPPLF